jgi:3-hydroxypropanoate dehydrogenase
MDISVKDLFENGRSSYNFLSQKISHEILKEIYDLTKMGSTSYNCCPLRIVFVEADDAKKKLLACAMEGNVAAISAAPMTAIFAYDSRFMEKFSTLLPTMPQVADYFKDEKMAFDTAFRNSSLQAAYFMIVARSKGLSCGPMSGFDATKLDAMFFAGTTWKANFICNLGYAEGEAKYPRLPRLEFEDVCKII